MWRVLKFLFEFFNRKLTIIQNLQQLQTTRLLFSLQWQVCCTNGGFVLGLCCALTHDAICSLGVRHLLFQCVSKRFETVAPLVAKAPLWVYQCLVSHEIFWFKTLTSDKFSPQCTTALCPLLSPTPHSALHFLWGSLGYWICQANLSI